MSSERYDLILTEICEALIKIKTRQSVKSRYISSLLQNMKEKNLSDSERESSSTGPKHEVCIRRAYYFVERKR